MASRAVTRTRRLLRPPQYPDTPKHQMSQSFSSIYRHHDNIERNPNTPILKDAIHPDELEELLAKPTWSVESLLPPKTQPPEAPKISSQQLHHLLRLSALPLPRNPKDEQKMLDTLSAQLHFVGEIQQVDTTGVQPLRAIRDETASAMKEQTITLETLKDALEQERVIGKHYKRVQRNPDPIDASANETWDVLGSARKKVGKYFVVESERPQE